MARKRKEDFDIISDDEIDIKDKISQVDSFEELLSLAANIVVNTCISVVPV